MSWLTYDVDSDYIRKFNNAEMKLSNNGFKKIDLKCDDNYAIYYNDEIKELVAELNEKTDSADENDKGITYKLGSKK